MPIDSGLEDLNYMLDPLGRVRFFGIYSAKVIDNKDPLKKGRVKLQILQPTGTATTGWANSCLGAISQTSYPYGTFITTSSQSLPVGSATVVTNWQAEDTNKTYKSGTKLYVQETGDYFFQFSAMLTKSNASTGTAEIWIRKNGADISNSNTSITLSGSGAEATMTVGVILDLNAGDYIELVGTASSTNTSINYHAATSSPTRPAVPGVIATINLIGKYVPKPGTKVWAMFESGDPEFPVWIGVQE